MTGAAEKLSGNERFLFPMFRGRIDRFMESYTDTCKKNEDNIRRRYTKSTTVEKNYDRIPNLPPYTKSTTVYDRIPKLPSEEETEYKAEYKSEEEYKAEAEYKGRPAPAERHSHGEYGWVKLTDEQYSKLLKDLGAAELERCIEYVDESAQRTGNKNGWKDWNLVVRKCHRERWGAKCGVNESRYQAADDWAAKMEGGSYDAF